MGRIRKTFGFIFSHPLGKRHPLKTFTRFISWQLQSRLFPSKYIIKSFIDPVKFYARKGLTGITGNIYTGLHEFNDMAFLLHFLRPADVFFDVGANVGSYTLLASGVCKAKTIAIEPSANTVALLNNNLVLNNLLNRVTIINKAAGVGEALLTFSKNEDAENHVLAKNEISNAVFETVSIVNIDSLTVKDKPALIKIDVEGYETEVLRGMADTLKQASLKAIIIELNGNGMRYGFNEHDIHLLLMANDFKSYQYDPFKRELFRIDSYGDYNTIYCRDIEFVNDRVKTGGKFKIMGETI